MLAVAAPQVRLSAVLPRRNHCRNNPSRHYNSSSSLNNNLLSSSGRPNRNLRLNNHNHNPNRNNPSRSPGVRPL